MEQLFFFFFRLFLQVHMGNIGNEEEKYLWILLVVCKLKNRWRK